MTTEPPDDEECERGLDPSDESTWPEGWEYSDVAKELEQARHDNGPGR